MMERLALAVEILPVYGLPMNRCSSGGRAGTGNPNKSLDKICTRYKMEISAERTKLMPNRANGIQREIKVKGQKLGTVTSVRYLGAVVSDDGSKSEVLSMIAQATAAFTKLKPIWRDIFCIKGGADMLPFHFHISIYL